MKEIETLRTTHITHNSGMDSSDKKKKNEGGGEVYGY